MNIRTQTTVIALCLAILSIQFISCKKEDTPDPADKEDVDCLPTAKENLVAWYKFTNGNTADFSGENNHLTAYNVTPATDFKGRPNNAFAFDGSSSYMEAANSTSLNPSKITLAALFKPTGFYLDQGSTSRILMKGADDQSNGVYFLGYFNTGVFYGGYGNNQYESNGALSPANSLELNTWYKLIYTYDGNVGKLYINGDLVDQSNKTASFIPNSDVLKIGLTGRSDYPYWFNGIIDEIRIYNTALSTTEITAVTSEIGK